MSVNYLDVGLKEQEYLAIMDILGREPNMQELRILGVMWSEHCSYKSTRPLLSMFPNSGGAVVQGPGENAGIVDIGGGWGAAFKVESHNHPSAVSPYQGAATGVGGIIRDILAMGARPVASLDGLCLGDESLQQSRSLADGIVKGIAGYGNAVGVPTVGGKTLYDGCYNGNPLVNAMCLGVVRLDSIVSSKTARPGHLAILVGSRTGRDGIAGAAFASSGLADDTRASRPQVQIGDPFVEKLLIECCLEIHSKGLMVAMQDMGAAGITSSSSEIAAKSGTGIVINSELVPLRENDMEPWEIALSESQERMLLVAEQENLPEISKIAAKWELECAAIGKVTDDGQFVISDKGKIVVSLPAGMVGGSCPVISWTSREPSGRKATSQKGTTFSLSPHMIEKHLVTLLSNPSLSDKSGIFHQYDYMVQTGTVVPPGSAASIIRVRENGKLLGLAMEVDPWKCEIDPFTGSAEVFLKALRSLWVAGAEHLGMTNCLNFPSPEDPGNFWVISRCVEGLAAVARDLVCPVVSGNVSLYNESGDAKILPSPLVGVTGTFRDIAKPLSESFSCENETVFLAGFSKGTLNGSHFARAMAVEQNHREFPYLPEKEKIFMHSAIETVRKGLATSGRTVAGGGLLVSLAKMCVTSGIGISIDEELPLDDLAVFLFGETGPRAIYTVTENLEKDFASIWSGIPLIKLGQTGGKTFTIKGLLEIPVNEIARAWRR
ncbi:MAG TPA: phosphoribosylformylglycinamidine synthase subunit PurL [Synergistales bacterium]|nr:phosphoribosylformylglycinamidine synthase subunit PurL [Synergistales bacterium]HRV70744.1 phosphoribosylformylglycinamidine synthase subunit PurL [Thermovirgaceae bacterium]